MVVLCSTRSNLVDVNGFEGEVVVIGWFIW